MASEDDKNAAREYLKSIGIKPNTDKTTPEQYAAKIHAPDNYGSSSDMPVAPVTTEVSSDPSYDNATAPALDALPEDSAVPQIPVREPQSAAIEATQGVPASIAAPAEVPTEISPTLPSGGPVIDPLAEAPKPAEKTMAERHAELVKQYTQSLANQDYSSGAGKKTPEEAARNWAEYVRKADSMATDTLSAEQDTKNAATENASKSAIADESRRYQQALGTYQKQVTDITAQNEKRAKIGLAPLPLPEAPVAPQSAVDAQKNNPDAAEQNAVEAAAMPQAEELHKAAAEALAPIREERAAQVAQVAAAEELAGYGAQDEKRARDAQAQLDSLEKQTTDEVRASSLHEMLNTGNLGSKLGAAFAVMLGGVSQGLTGAKTNPVVDFINNAVEQQAQKDKLTLAKKEGLRKLLLEEATLKVHALTQQTDNMYKKGELANAAAKIDIARDTAAKALQKELMAEQLRAKANKLIAGVSEPIPTATPEIAQHNKDLEAALDSTRESDPKKYAEIAEKLVVLPNGKKVIATAPKERVQNFETQIRPDLEMAINALKDLDTFTKNASVLDPKAHALAASKLNVIAGQLRIPLTGPGVLTQEEFNRILRTIGNPLKIAGLRDWETAKLHSTISAITSQLKTKAAAIGVQWPMTTREIMSENLRQKGYEPVQIEAALAKKGL